MTIKTAIPTFCAGFCLLLAGCVPVSTETRQAPTGDAQASPSVAEPVLAVNQSVADIQAKRQMERELDRDHNAFLKRMSERNVDAALEFVIPESRPKMQTDLWHFMADYSFDNFEVISKSMNLSAKEPTAEVKAVLVVYQKNVVAPAKKEYSTKWKRTGDKWLIVP